MGSYLRVGLSVLLFWTWKLHAIISFSIPKQQDTFNNCWMSWEFDRIFVSAHVHNGHLKSLLWCFAPKSILLLPLMIPTLLDHVLNLLASPLWNLALPFLRLAQCYTRLCHRPNNTKPEPPDFKDVSPSWLVYPKPMCTSLDYSRPLS